MEKEKFLEWRNEYLDLCRKCAVLPRGQFGISLNVPDEYKVVFNKIAYYPQGYELDFDVKGNARHTAILHDLKANSITRAPLMKIRKYLGGKNESEGK